MRKIMKMVFLAVLIAGIIPALALAGGKQEEGGAAEEAKPEMAKVREFGMSHDNPEWQEKWTIMGNGSVESAGIRLVPTDLETQVYKSKVKTDLTTSRAPGVFKWWFGYRAFELLDAGLLADLGDVWDEVEGSFPDGVRDALTINGVTYAFPFNSGYWVWYYSKPVYEKYGLSLPETWDEFIEQLAFLKEKGVSGIGNTIGASRWTSFIIFEELLYRIDADFYNELVNGRAHYTDAPVVQAMELWKEMLEAGYFAPMDTEYATDFPRMMKEGELAFAPFGDWYGGILQQQGLVPNEDYGVFIPPAITPKGEGAIILEISPLCVGVKSPDVEIAKEWFKWYASAEAAQILWDEFKFATTNHITVDAIAAADPVLAEEYKLLENYPKKLIRFWEATPVEIVEHAVDAFNTMLVHPDQYMELLESIEAKAKETWPKYGVNNY